MMGFKLQPQPFRPAELQRKSCKRVWIFGDRKGTTKKLCDKDLAERSSEVSGAICLKPLVLLGNGR